MISKKHCLCPVKFSFFRPLRVLGKAPSSAISWASIRSVFRALVAEGKFVEFEEVYPDRFYGTLKSEVNRIWAKGHVIIFDVDVKGGVSLKKYFGESALSVFIQAPSVEELRKRLIARGTDPMDAIETRVAKAAEEMTYAPQFDKVLVNDHLATALREAETLVNNFLNN